MRQCQQILIFSKVIKNVIFCIVVSKNNKRQQTLNLILKLEEEIRQCKYIIALSNLINLCTSEIGHDTRILMCSCALPS